MKYFIFLCMIVLPLIFSSASHSIPIQWSENGHWYEVVSYTFHGTDWLIAKSIAESRTYEGIQGHLVTLTSAEENQWVWNNLGGDSLNGYFLGASDYETEGVWQWVTGEAWDYTNWDNGEPNNYLWGPGIGEDGLQFTTGGLWNDMPIYSFLYRSLGFIIEYDAEPVPEPDPEPVPEPATLILLGLGFLGFSYKIRKITVNH